MVKDAKTGIQWLLFFFGALLIQISSLVSFIEASRLEQGTVLKMITIVFAFVLSILFVVWAQKRSINLMGMILHAAILAIAYLIAFHLVGFLMYRGLLSGLQFDDFSYAVSLMKIFGLLFLLYLSAEFVVRWILIRLRLHRIKK